MIVENEIITNIYLFFRLLNYCSIKKFFTIYHFISSLGLAMTVGEGINFVVNLSKMEYLICVILILITISLCLMFGSYKAYEKTVAEILETGYFFNFFKDIALHIFRCRNKPVQSEFKLLEFKFKDGEKDPIKVNVEQTEVVVVLPQSYNALENNINKINKFELDNLDNKYWVNFKINNNKITIYEYPRTLKPLPEYLKLITEKDQDINFIENLSQIYHRHFNDKFNKDWKELKDDLKIISPKALDDIFTIIPSLP